MEVLLIAGAFLIGFILVLLSVPPILKVAKEKKLYEPFEERKIHSEIVPPLGGIAIFIGFVLSSIIATDGLSFDSLKYIVASVIAMFFIGLKDDLLNISARKKLIVQVFAAVLLITLGNVRFTSLHGFLGTTDIGYIPGLILSVFAIIVIVNSFNLVDGIDGLASGLAMLAAGIFGTWFFISGNPQFAILSFALVGSLFGFFLYNVFGHKNKLFMGDTGSLIIGLVIATLVIKFNEFNILKDNPYAIDAAPVVSFAIVIVPLIDTLRVMTIRIMQKKSPFLADNNHVHHRLLSLYQSHLKVTAIIVATNLMVVGIALWFNYLGFSRHLQFIFIFLIGVGLSQIPSVLIRIKNNKPKGKSTEELKPATWFSSLF